MATAVTSVRERATISPGREISIPRSSAAYRVSMGLALIAAAAGALTFFVPDVLRGPAVMNGSGRGTGLMVLVVAVAVLIVSLLAVAHGSIRAIVTWAGAVAFILYNSVLMLFATPFNSLFLLYCAMLALSIWAAITILRQINPERFAERFETTPPTRPIAIYLWVLTAFYGVAWLGRILPELFSGDRAEFLVGTGLPTNPIFVQDLSFWLPLMAISAWWLWRTHAWGYVLAGAMLVFGVIESVTIAVDQYMGSVADPSSSVASAAMTPVFAVVALIGLVPLFFYMRPLKPQGSSPSPGSP